MYTVKGCPQKGLSELFHQEGKGVIGRRQQTSWRKARELSAEGKGVVGRRQGASQSKVRLRPSTSALTSGFCSCISPSISDELYDFTTS